MSTPHNGNASLMLPAAQVLLGHRRKAAADLAALLAAQDKKLQRATSLRQSAQRCQDVSKQDAISLHMGSNGHRGTTLNAVSIHDDGLLEDLQALLERHAARLQARADALEAEVAAETVDVVVARRETP